MPLFTTLNLPDSLRDRIAALRAPERLNARWTSPDQYHAPLRFIGEADALASSESGTIFPDLRSTRTIIEKLVR